MRRRPILAPQASTEPSHAPGTFGRMTEDQGRVASTVIQPLAGLEEGLRRRRGTAQAGEPAVVVREAHPGGANAVGGRVLRREEREAALDALLAPGATRPVGAGNRAVAEPADAHRLCFERDLDRVKHSSPWRRLAGKCQVFIAPEDDHLRTRLTHAVEVAQVATGIARAAQLCVPLAEAIALAHDCGHGPAGHASETAFSPYMAEGVYDHAVYGADVTLSGLNLCTETLDGVRNHSWRRPAPATPEGEVVSWADRIAYVCHDFEDAVRAGIVRADELPVQVQEMVGTRRSAQLNAFITGMLAAIADTGRVGMRPAEAGALAAFREFNFDRIYLRPASVAQAERVIELLRALTEWYAVHPAAMSDEPGALADPLAAAVHHVSGMTDRYALRMAVEHLGWDAAKLPRGV